MRTGIALGSNLGDRLENLRRARSLLSAYHGIEAPILSARVYETEPVDTGPESGPFLNSVIEVTSTLQPFLLLEALQEIESLMGRPSKRPRNAPRTIDLDVLYIGNLVLANAELVIPHPRLHLRRFVLAPLSDIRPDLLLPGQQHAVAELLAQLSDPASATLHTEVW
jgi:2-amino-4-hydroxy-6-hydroxymethyldihydropteridine diphosphokinase